AIYQLSISARTASSAEGLLNSLMETVDRTLNRPSVLIMKHGETVFAKAAKIKLSEDLIQRIADIGQRSNSRIYFGLTNTLPRKETFAWIPLVSETHSGGIYIICCHHQLVFTERE